jgi:hypothetical protein
MNKPKISLTHLVADIMIAQERDIVYNVKTYPCDDGRCNIIAFNTQVMSVDIVTKLRIYLETQCQDIEHVAIWPDVVRIRYKV